MPPVTNIAAYQFAPLADLKPLRDRLAAMCRTWSLKGTILLSTEGINLFVAGPRTEIDLLLAELRAVPGLESLSPKVSESADQPFTRMLVKIKREIIAFGVEGIDPARRPAPKLSPRELKSWLDEGRPVTLLDTRNEFEVKLGTFENAVPIGIKHFREFPEAVKKLPEEMKQQPIVMFCTGGIRCEKAGPFMQREGFEQIFQLDGGILKYFEDCGGDHYQGECFVFDKRVGVDPGLAETANTQCFVCLRTLNGDEQNDPRYVEGKSCPHCFRSSEEQRLRELAEHQAAIVRVTRPLPGSVPKDNYRPLKVAGVHDGRRLLDFLHAVLGHIPHLDWQTEFERGHIVNAAYESVGPDQVVRSGERYFHHQVANLEADVNAAITILHEDDAIIVLNKPAPLPIHPSGRFNRNTLQAILREVYSPQKPRPAHRLDANTTGVVVFTRIANYARILQPQFERGEVEKVYLARVIGHPPEDKFHCEAAISATSGDFGSRTINEESGLRAFTEFRVLNCLNDGTALLEVIPHTGRTNQIRVHLWHLGYPIRGDQAYLPDRQPGDTQTHSVDDPPLCLHAYRLTFTHPLTGKRVTFEAPLPQWAR